MDDPREIRIIVGDKTVGTFSESEVTEVRVTFDDGESTWTWSGRPFGWVVEGAYADRYGDKGRMP